MYFLSSFLFFIFFCGKLCTYYKLFILFFYGERQGTVAFRGEFLDWGFGVGVGDIGLMNIMGVI